MFNNTYSQTLALIVNSCLLKCIGCREKFLRATSILAGVLLRLSPVRESSTEHEYCALESSKRTDRMTSRQPSSARRVGPAAGNKTVDSYSSKKVLL